MGPEDRRTRNVQQRGTELRCSAKKCGGMAWKFAATDYAGFRFATSDDVTDVGAARPSANLRRDTSDVRPESECAYVPGVIRTDAESQPERRHPGESDGRSDSRTGRGRKQDAGLASDSGNQRQRACQPDVCHAAGGEPLRAAAIRTGRRLVYFARYSASSRDKLRNRSAAYDQNWLRVFRGPPYFRFRKRRGGGSNTTAPEGRIARAIADTVSALAARARAGSIGPVFPGSRGDVVASVAAAVAGVGECRGATSGEGRAF